MMDLFDSDTTDAEGNIFQKNIPLAERLRPKVLDEVVGQDKILSSNSQLKSMVRSGQLSSIIFWGPPGVGKTTLARVIANEVRAHYEEISAVFSGVSDLKKLLDTATLRHANGSKTILFVDEIHWYPIVNFWVLEFHLIQDYNNKKTHIILILLHRNVDCKQKYLEFLYCLIIHNL